MDRFVRDFPEARTCPPDTIRRLREIDPNAEVLYLGPSPKGGRWLLGTMDPESEPCRTAWRRLAVHLARNPTKRNRDWAQRVALEQAKRQGFKPRTVYEGPEPGGDLVERVRWAHYDHLNTADHEFFRQLDEARELERRALEADLSDSGRSREAWHYTFTRSHSVTRFDDPMKKRTRAGWKTVATIS